MSGLAVAALLALVDSLAHWSQESVLLARAKRHPACGSEDWDIKTAADPRARLIDLTPRPTTISALTSARRPSRRGGVRVRGIETTTWKLTNVRLLEARTEADQDIHLVVGEREASLIVEIPAPECLPSTSVVRDAVTRARAVAELNLSRKGGFSNIITVAGVGYFDHEHRQLGAAWNQIELHPVTAICFGQDCKLDGAETASATTADAPLTELGALSHEDTQAKAARAVCESHARAQAAAQTYRGFVSTCQSLGQLASRDCRERATGTMAKDARAAMIDANDRENEFLRAWGVEAFLAITCE
jgi:hypothetical protein